MLRADFPPSISLEIVGSSSAPERWRMSSPVAAAPFCSGSTFLKTSRSELAFWRVMSRDCRLANDRLWLETYLCLRLTHCLNGFDGTGYDAIWCVPRNAISASGPSLGAISAYCIEESRCLGAAGLLYKLDSIFAAVNKS